MMLVITFTAFGQASPRRTAEGTIDGVNIVVDYGAPYVKGRTIWGGLEAYDKVWRAGANLNTTVTFSEDVKISNKSLKAGKYGFFIIPKQGKPWTIIFNKRNGDWGAFSYDQTQDALRLDVKPIMNKDVQEQLLYEVGEKAIKMHWEKVTLSIPVQKRMINIFSHNN